MVCQLKVVTENLGGCLPPALASWANCVIAHASDPVNFGVPTVGWVVQDGYYTLELQQTQHEIPREWDYQIPPLATSKAPSLRSLLKGVGVETVYYAEGIGPTMESGTAVWLAYVIAEFFAPLIDDLVAYCDGEVVAAQDFQYAMREEARQHVWSLIVRDGADVFPLSLTVYSQNYNGASPWLQCTPGAVAPVQFPSLGWGLLAQVTRLAQATEDLSKADIDISFNHGASIYSLRSQTVTEP